MIGFVPVRVWKEVRGLTPAWLASMALMVAAGFGDRLRAAGLLGYLVGAIALGALSMGHEYNSRTLTLMLSQPARRESVFIKKFGVLLAMLLTLAAIAWVGPLAVAGTPLDFPEQWRRLAVGLPLVAGLFLAPWLTMVCRNALAGVVFAIAVPGAVWLGSEMTSTWIYGGELSTTIVAAELTLEIFWRAILIVSAIAAVSTWWMFMRLEAIETRGAHFNLPSWVSTRATSTEPAGTGAHPVLLLAAKELRLQQLTIAVSGLYVVGWFGFLLFGGWLPPPASRGILLSATTIIHALAIPLLAGSLASAEERHLGTLGWQVLLPMGAWRQWLLKVTVVAALTLMLALGLPAVLTAMTSLNLDEAAMRAFFSPATAFGLLVVAIISLYVSSLNPNGMRAILISAPVVVVIGVLSRVLSSMNVDRRFSTSLLLSPNAYVAELLGPHEHMLRAALIAVASIAAAGIPTLLLRFALVNHRTAERGAGRVWRQLGIVGVVTVVLMLVGSRVSSAYVESITRRFETRQRTTGTRVAFRVDGVSAADLKDVVVLVFAEGGGAFNVRVSRQGDFLWNLNLLKPSSDLSAVAVLSSTASQMWRRDFQRDYALRHTLRERAVPLAFRKDELVTVDLPLTTIP